ncbi:hypothetical protein EYF80_003138 [Liparis tanakae]|uniref:Uncharacterized protein n=1 Tax=Liparis tanakae TaxID=230148 RepID=A0A4Z2J985_9TELE|nr:hypothetical protein EYF80_003138 [Liparis tanakae]
MKHMGHNNKTDKRGEQGSTHEEQDRDPNNSSPKVFNVWLSSHIWLFRHVRSQLIATRCFDQRQRVSFRRSPVFNTAASSLSHKDSSVQSPTANLWILLITDNRSQFLQKLTLMALPADN